MYSVAAFPDIYAQLLSFSLGESVQLFPSLNENTCKKVALTSEEKQKLKNILSRFKIKLSQLLSDVVKLW